MDVLIQIARFKVCNVLSEILRHEYFNLAEPSNRYMLAISRHVAGSSKVGTPGALRCPLARVVTYIDIPAAVNYQRGGAAAIYNNAHIRRCVITSRVRTHLSEAIFGRSRGAISVLAEVCAGACE